MDPAVRKTLPPWGLSVGLHAVLIVLLGLIYQSAPVHSSPAENIRPVEIVLRDAQAVGAPRFADSAAGGAAAPQASIASTAPHTVFRPPAIDLSGALPGGAEGEGAASIAGGSGASPEAMAGAGLFRGTGNLIGGAARGKLPGDPLPVSDDPAAPAGRPGPTGPPAEISLFGRKAQGHRFVFVVDRSNSMGRGLHYILEAAKTQLNTALGQLQENHEFQIVFYNDRPSQFRPGAMLPANDANKKAAREFVTRMTAAGSTQHDLAMYAAVKLRPQVIFLLTDAHPPQLSKLEMDIIKKNNDGTFVIHTIEFGVGKPFEEDNFLKRLAAENGGEYRYIDVTQPVP